MDLANCSSVIGHGRVTVDEAAAPPSRALRRGLVVASTTPFLTAGSAQGGGAERKGPCGLLGPRIMTMTRATAGEPRDGDWAEWSI